MDKNLVEEVAKLIWNNEYERSNPIIEVSWSQLPEWSTNVYLTIAKAIIPIITSSIKEKVEGIENTFPKTNDIYGDEGYHHTENDGSYIGFNEAIRAVLNKIDEVGK